MGRGVAGGRGDLRPGDAVGRVGPLGHFAPRESASVFGRNLVRRGNAPADGLRSIARVRLDRDLLVGEDGAGALVRKCPLHRHAGEQRLGLLELWHGPRVGLLAGRGLGAGAVAEDRGRFLLWEGLEGGGAGHRVGAQGQGAGPVAAAVAVGVAVGGGDPGGGRGDRGEHLERDLCSDWLLGDVCV